MKRIVSFIICFMLLTGCGGVKFETIDSNMAMELIEDKAVVIDVRESHEFITGHIKDAVNVPLSQINGIDYDKETVIIVYCATGMRSSEAAKSLINNGYTKVYNLDGGLINWGFDLVTE